MKSLKLYLIQRMKVDPPSNCWNWTGSLNSYRYGSACFKSKREMAHRLSYKEFVGVIPDGMNVCHKCDNTKCINPSHLFLGTQKDNLIDCSLKGRLSNRPQSFKKGEGHIRSKLTTSDVIEIKRNLAIGMRTKDISSLFKVKPCTICDIKYGRRWKHIGELNGKM